MRGFDPAKSFGPEVASHYDDVPRGDEEAAVAFLHSLAGDGPALELAIGTGRIALPLAASGTKVDGIDLSTAMIERLRQRPGGDTLNVTIGDFSEVAMPGSYSLIYVVFNTFFNLLTQDDQVRCFENVAKRLAPGGAFVIEAFTPGYLHRLRDHQYVDAEQIEVDEVTFDVGRHDPVNQILDESHVALTRDGIKLFPIVCRYCWPSELDLMARIAGLQLTERWGTWERSPFTADSVLHVSVFRSED